MEQKDQPPAYSPPTLQAQPLQGGNLYQYPAQANFGYTAQPTDFGQSQSAVVVTRVTAVGVGPNYNVPPQDYTTQAWLACLCCFWPTGLLAIMRANESRDAVARGDMVGAHSAASGARQMVRVSIIVGIIGTVFGVVFVVIWYAVIASSIYSGY